MRLAPLAEALERVEIKLKMSRGRCKNTCHGKQMKMQPSLLPHAANTGGSQGTRTTQDYAEEGRAWSAVTGMCPSQKTSYQSCSPATPTGTTCFPPGSPESPTASLTWNQMPLDSFLPRVPLSFLAVAVGMNVLKNVYKRG